MPQTLADRGYIVVHTIQGWWEVPAQRLSLDQGRAEDAADHGNRRAGLAGRGPGYQIAFVIVEALVPCVNQIRAWLAARGWRQLTPLAGAAWTEWQAGDGLTVRVPDDGDPVLTVTALETIADAAAMSPAALARDMTEGLPS